jgi:hypothetical protein
MGHRNSLISGDNKGVASRFMEDWFERKDYGRMDSDVLGNDDSPQRISNIIPGLRDNRMLLTLCLLYNATIDEIISFFSDTDFKDKIISCLNSNKISCSKF